MDEGHRHVKGEGEALDERNGEREKERWENESNII